MFFIAAIFMIIGFVVLAGMLALPEITQEKLFHETSYIDRNLQNIQREYERTVVITTSQPVSNRSDFVYNFSRLVRSDLNSRIIYAMIVANGSSQRFSATMGNFMQDRITGNITIPGATPGSASFNLGDMQNASFGFAGTNTTFAVFLNYTMQNANFREVFYFSDSTRNYAALFQDIQIGEGDYFVRSKSTYNRTW
jgi:hypothetical protein